MSILKFDEVGMRTVLIACVAALTASCSASQTAPVADFEVATTVAPAVAHIGDKMVVTVTATNISTKSQDIPTNDCFTAFAVLDSAATQVGPSAQQVCTASAKMVTLAPGAQYSVTQQWTGDAIRATPDAQPAMVRPGTYTVNGNLGLGASVRTVPATVRLTL